MVMYIEDRGFTRAESKERGPREAFILAGGRGNRQRP